MDQLQFQNNSYNILKQYSSSNYYLHSAIGTKQ